MAAYHPRQSDAVETVKDAMEIVRPEFEIISRVEMKLIHRKDIFAVEQIHFSIGDIQYISTLFVIWRYLTEIVHALPA
ncbi:hypothetical protein NT2_07_00610 [Caenibius tardaugens NBRC 16725]|uniref:Uncharacterized protein n=1 Tax=Caenibius tardaugens NBRC 16725 TaxID=1219035 RepID=U2Y9Q1_9SPHN|nr:hypothetical protein [Caenibius tardaugens]AZI35652.1 hypothetical protein EGO55_06465 [Caenibius tardaugens NBRC 16725]GAD50061.1 hypothetical protein NT2_07_00610 [Caenibius tardaugens NBRC 16725]